MKNHQEIEDIFYNHDFRLQVILQPCLKRKENKQNKVVCSIISFIQFVV